MPPNNVDLNALFVLILVLFAVGAVLNKLFGIDTDSFVQGAVVWLMLILPAVAAVAYGAWWLWSNFAR